MRRRRPHVVSGGQNLPGQPRIAERHLYPHQHQHSAAPTAMNSTVMGPVADQAATCEFSDKIPPRFDGHGDYSSYREDVVLWTKLTTLPAEKHGPAVVGRLHGEAKTAAKTLPAESICKEGGVDLIMKRLDKAYAIDKTNQLDADLADFLDYSWKKEVSIEHFISGFHTRVDKISSLNLDDKLKGHLMLRQADLEYQEKHVVIGAASGSYDVNHISAALRNIYRLATPSGATHHGRGSNFDSDNDGRGTNEDNGGRGRGRGRRNRRNRQHEGPPGTQGRHGSKPTFYSYKTSATTNVPSVIIDTGACSSVVGKETLDDAMRRLNIDSVEDTKIRQKHHRFGNYDEQQPSIFGVKMPFDSMDQNNNPTVQFDVAFDVIEGNLPFLLGLPSLIAMGATLNHKYLTLGFSLNGKYNRLQLVKNGDHICLPFQSETIVLNGNQQGDGEGAQQTAGRKYYSISGNENHVKGKTRNQRSYYTISKEASSSMG